MPQPLITFALFAYKQDRFIRDAVEGAFAQTYSPLEIILSDDCSPDGTFEIMREMAAAYCGPHRIVLNRNPENIGVASHVNKVCALLQGDLIVAAAGDDVSLPERTTTLYEAWLASGGEAHSIYSDAIIIDANGNRSERWFSKPSDVAKSLKDAISGKEVVLLGAAHMFSRRTFEVFGPLNPGVLLEDHAIPFRSLILGRVEYVPVPLVLYRRHGENMYQTPNDRLFHDNSRRKKWLHGEVALFKGMMADLQEATETGLVDMTEGLLLSAIIRRSLEEKRLELVLAESGLLRRLFNGIRAVVWNRLSPIKVANLFVDSFASPTFSLWWCNFKKALRRRRSCTTGTGSR